VEQELLALPEHLSLLKDLRGFCGAVFIVCCVVFCQSLIILLYCSNLAIVVSVLLLENIYINAYNALYYKNLRIIFVFVQNNIEFDRSVCALFCDFHRYRGYHIRDQRESTRLRQANTNTLNHDSYQKKNVTSQSTQNCRWNHFTSQTMIFICGIMLPLKQWWNRNCLHSRSIWVYLRILEVFVVLFL
jgi:hypothetical protein